MNETQNPAHSYPPQRRQRRRMNPQFVAMIVVIGLLAVALVACVAFLLSETEEQKPDAAPTQSLPTTPSQSEPITEPTVSEPTVSEPTEPSEPITEPTKPTTEPTKPTTEPTEPSTEPTEPPELTPMQKLEQFAAANGLTMADYPEKLIEMLGRNEQTLEFVMNYPLKYGQELNIDISGYADTPGVPLFIQWDQQWGYKDYVGNVAGLSGCGPTCMSMVMYHFTRDPAMHPAYMMDFAESNSAYATVGGATLWSFFKLGGAELGLTVKEMTYDDLHIERNMKRLLESGKVLVVNVGPGIFTEIGHYMVIAGYEDGKFIINDPNSPANSAKRWEFEEFNKELKMGWIFSYDGGNG